MFERDTQFTYTEIGNFPNDFMSFNELNNFYTEIGKFADICIYVFEWCMQILSDGYFAFSEYPMKNK